MTTSTESSTLALLDTNVLVYAFDTQAEHHNPSRAILSHAADANAGLCIAPRISRSFTPWSLIGAGSAHLSHPHPPPRL